MKFLDLADEMSPKRKRMGRKWKMGPIKMRDPRDVIAVCAHQTAVEFGARPKHRRRAFGDEGLAVAYRVAEDVPAHMVSLGRFGINVRGIPMEAYANHAGKPFNAMSYGYEIEGCYPGLTDDPKTAPNEARRTFWGEWRRRTPWTAEKQDCAEEGLQRLVEDGRELGSPLQYWVAHRQSSKNRRSDPGQEIWQGLTPFAIHLGLTPQPFARFGGGRWIPAAWGGFGAY